MSQGEAAWPGSLTTPRPVRTVESYWPYATTLFDYIRRAMPYDRPTSLSSDDVYAASAYLLELSGIIPADLEMNKKTLPSVEMPNRDGFIASSVRNEGTNFKLPSQEHTE